MDLTGYKIFDIYGIKNITLSGDYDAATLVKKLIDAWIPYIDCERKCNRSEYCKYTKPSPYHPGRLTDIQCGIGVDTINNFISSTFHIFEKLPTEYIENYLGAAFYFSQFVLAAEEVIGTCISKDAIEWFGEYAPMIFGRVAHLRNQLNNLASSLKNIPDFKSERGVLFVEGWTEKAFLDKLRESHSSWFLQLNIEVYHGKGNRKPKRIEMLLDNYNRLGYKIYIQGDADGQHSDIFNDLVIKGHVTADCTFVFKYDFESSIPPGLLLAALHDLGEIPKIDIAEFGDKLSPLDCSVVKKLKEVFKLDLDPIKIDVASIIAEKLNDKRWAWWQSDEFMKTELGQFIRFIQHIL